MPTLEVVGQITQICCVRLDTEMWEWALSKA